MSEPINKWQAVLNQLAAGEEIDWDTQDVSNQAEASVLQQLKSIYAIQQVFAAQKINHYKVERSDIPVLFEWGHLQVLDKLGSGGYGEVFRAFDPVLNRDVALKLLKPGQLAAFHSKLFIEEAQRIARVRNRHVLAIHGAGVNQGKAGFWSDLIVGKTLVTRDKLKQNELWQVASALTQALQAVHQAGLVHGDVKAANVMQDQQGQYVLMDFGAGLDREAQQSSNHLVGSPMLMAPELFQEALKSTATDIYALGCLLFKLASGRYPIAGANILDVANAHKQSSYKNLSELRPDLSKSFLELIQSMLKVAPEERPVADVILLKLSLIKSEPRRRRKRRMVMLVIASLLVGLVSASVGLYFANAERKKAVLAQQKSQAVNDFLHQVLGSSFSLGTGREVRVADVLDLAASNSLEDFKNQPEILAELTKTLGQSYQNLQVMDKSREQLTKSLALKRSLMGEAHPETLRVMLLLAKTEESMGHFQASKQLCESVIALTHNDEKVQSYHLDAQVILAAVYTSLGQFEQAEAMLTQIIQLAKENATPSNHLFLALMAQSENYLKLSNFNAAVETAEQAIDTVQKVENHKPTNVLAAKNQLAVALSSQGNYAEAEIILSELLALAEQFYGKNNIGYLRVLINLGANLQSQGKLTQAVAFQEQAVGLTVALFGHRNHNTLMSKMNLANTYVSLRRLDEGEVLMRETLALAASVNGAVDVTTLTLQYNLGELLNMTERYDESLSISLESLEVMETALGTSHLVTLLTHDNMAVSMTGLARYKEAQTLFIKTLSGIETAFGQTNPYFLLVLGHQIDALVSSGDVVIAIELLKQKIVIQQQMLGESSEEVLQSENELKELLTSVNNR